MVKILTARPISYKMLGDTQALAQRNIATIKAKPGFAFRSIYETNRIIDAGFVLGASVLGGAIIGLSFWPALLIPIVTTGLGYALSRAEAKLNIGKQAYTCLDVTHNLMQQTTEKILRGDKQPQNVGLPRSILGALGWGAVLTLPFWGIFEILGENNNVRETLGPIKSNYAALGLAGLISLRIAFNRILQYMDFRSVPLIAAEATVEELHHEKFSIVDENGNAEPQEYYRGTLSVEGGREVAFSGPFPQSGKSTIFYSIGVHSGNLVDFKIAPSHTPVADL